MHDKNRIPRWLVENDPSWEKSIDSNLGMLKWTKKGTGIQATCQPISMFCEVMGQTEQAGLSDIASNMGVDKRAELLSGASDIVKYLSSGFLNPAINGPGLDLRKNHNF